MREARSAYCFASSSVLNTLGSSSLYISGRTVSGFGGFGLGLCAGAEQQGRGVQAESGHDQAETGKTELGHGGILQSKTKNAGRACAGPSKSGPQRSGSALADGRR